MSKPPVVETINLTKAYNGTVVVDKVNLRVEEGDIFGFLGPNGAGKTTTILMLLGLTEPTSGEARICGYNSTREPLRVKRLAGYVPERVGFYEDLSANYNIQYTARLNGFSDQMIKKRLDEAMEIVGLAGEANRKVGEFSRGMKQRLAFADLLVKMPKVAFLDEPTSGIDPEGARQILDLISRIAKEQQMSIVMSSHQLTHVQQICKRIGMIAKGKIVVEGSLEQLGRETLSGGRFGVEIQLSKVTPAIMDSIKGIDGVISVDRTGNALLVSCSRDLRPQIARAIVDANGLLVQMNVQSYALEDIYLKYSREA